MSRNGAGRIRVMIVEDSLVVRQLLEYIIAADPRLEVVASAGGAEEALRLLGPVAPDVISMDLRLPKMDGLEAIRRIMATRPTPTVVVSGCVRANDLKDSMEALQAGALAVLEKPVGTTHADYQALAERLCTQLAIMSRVKVVRRRFSPERPPVRPQPADPQPAPAANGSDFGILALGASTGGPRALVSVLSDLAADFPLPILVVQHIGSAFAEGFVRWLDEVTPFRALVAKDGEVPQAGTIYLAPPDTHLRHAGGLLRLERSAPVCVQRPSVTVLFESLARSAGPRTLAVILTGMGEDGAYGLSAIRTAGGHTIAEDESTAVVYGMPGAAVRLGAVCESLPLPMIGSRLEQLVSPRRVRG